MTEKETTQPEGKTTTEGQNQDTNDNDVTSLIESLRQELQQDEAAKKQENDKKLQELEEKTFSKDEVKEMMKALLKEQQTAANESQLTKEEIEAMKEKLDKMSGSKVQTEVEEKPFTKPATETEKKVELTDEWVLKQKGII